MKRLLSIFTLCLLIPIWAKAIVITYGYFEHHNKMYYGNPSHMKSAILIWDADIRTFEVLNYGYAKDKKRAYYCGKEILGASPNIQPLGWSYAIDKTQSRVFYNGKTIHKAKTGSFEVLSSTKYWAIAKDKKHVFFENQVTYYDAKTFRLLKYKYFADKNGVYYDDDDNRIQIDANQNDTTFIDRFFIANNNVYLYGRKMQYDAVSFQLLDSYTWSGGGHSGHDGYLVRDNDSVYINDKSLTYDAASIEVLGKRIFKDKNGVHFVPIYEGFNKVEKLNLNPKYTKSRLLNMGKDYDFPCYIVGDNYFTYTFRNIAGEYLYRQNFGIDWETFELYYRGETHHLYKDKNNFYHLYHDKPLIRLAPCDNNPQIIYFDDRYIYIRSDDAVHRISYDGNINTFPKYVEGKYTSANTIKKPSSLVYFEGSKYYTDDFGYPESAFTDSLHIYDMYYISRRKDISTDLLQKLTPNIILPEEWENRRIETLKK